MSKNSDKKREKSASRQGQGGVLQALALATTIGMELAVMVVLGYYGGRYLDERLGTEPYMLLVGILGGLALGILGVYRTLTGFFERE